MSHSYVESTQDSIDTTAILDSIGLLEMISVQVLEDVICELQNEVDNRPVEAEEVEAGDWAEESREEIGRTENRIIDDMRDFT